MRDWCDNGMQQFKDDKTSFFSLPSNLFGAEYLLLNKKKTGPVSFSVNEDADIFVAIPSLSQKPEWLNAFVDTKTSLQNDEGTDNSFNIYRKRFLKAEKVSLSVKDDTIPFSVFALPVSNMQPAYDLKPVTSYKPLQAKVSTDAERATINSKDAVTFKSNTASMEWNITTGVADVYSITIRYANETGKNLNTIVELYSIDGTLMKSENIQFAQSIKGKWNYAVTNTGSMINAGNYIIKIKAADAVGLSISALDIQ
jgi:hypothetical protein